WNKRDARATAALRLRIDPTVIPQGGTTRDCRILCNSMQPGAPVAKMQFQLGSRTGNQCNIVARVDAITLQIRRLASFFCCTTAMPGPRRSAPAALASPGSG